MKIYLISGNFRTLDQGKSIQNFIRIKSFFWACCVKLPYDISVVKLKRQIVINIQDLYYFNFSFWTTRRRTFLIKWFTWIAVSTIHIPFTGYLSSIKLLKFSLIIFQAKNAFNHLIHLCLKRKKFIMFTFWFDKHKKFVCFWIGKPGVRQIPAMNTITFSRE